jgi:hypothetical protein
VWNFHVEQPVAVALVEPPPLEDHPGDDVGIRGHRGAVPPVRDGLGHRLHPPHHGVGVVDRHWGPAGDLEDRSIIVVLIVFRYQYEKFVEFIEMNFSSVTIYQKKVDVKI